MNPYQIIAARLVVLPCLPYISRASESLLHGYVRLWSNASTRDGHTTTFRREYRETSSEESTDCPNLILILAQENRNHVAYTVKILAG